MGYIDPMGTDSLGGMMKWVHGTLDVAGMIPFLGAVPDVINAGLYGIRGQYRMAAFSLGAAVPIIGDIAGGAKLVARGVKLVKTLRKTEEAATLAAVGAKVRVGGVNTIELAGRKPTQELAALQKAHKVEFAQIYITGPGKNGGGGNYYLIKGDAGTAPIPIGPKVRLINHTHPTTLNGNKVPLKASNPDHNVLKKLQEAGSPQRSSQIVPEDSTPFNFTR